MSDAERLRVYLAGWDDAYRQLLDTLDSVPGEHLSHVVAHMRSASRQPGGQHAGGFVGEVAG